MSKIKLNILKNLYYWIIDNNYTPYILFNSCNNYDILHNEFIIKNNNMDVLLNISNLAVNNLYWNNKHINFNTSFKSKIFNINITISSIISLYAFETLEGININDNNIEIIEQQKQNNLTLI